MVVAMAKETKPKIEKRRFEEEDRKPWTDEQRTKFNETAAKLAPFVKHLTTPPKKEKEKDPLEEFLGM
jgi:hypothetical protein